MSNSVFSLCHSYFLHNSCGGDFGDAVINRASFEQEAGIESYTTDDIGLEEESDPGESDASYNQNVDTEAVLSSDLRRRLVDRLRKRFNEED